MSVALLGTTFRVWPPNTPRWCACSGAATAEWVSVGWGAQEGRGCRAVAWCGRGARCLGPRCTVGRESAPPGPTCHDACPGAQRARRHGRVRHRTALVRGQRGGAISRPQRAGTGCTGPRVAWVGVRGAAASLPLEAAERTVAVEFCTRSTVTLPTISRSGLGGWGGGGRRRLALALQLCVGRPRHGLGAAQSQRHGSIRAAHLLHSRATATTPIASSTAAAEACGTGRTGAIKLQGRAAETDSRIPPERDPSVPA